MAELFQADVVTSLLSLAMAAENPTTTTTATTTTTSPPTASSAPHTKHHRRISSTGRTRRRLSDAREASARPSLSSSTAALSLASLTLSTSSPSALSLSKPLAPKPAAAAETAVVGGTGSAHVAPSSTPIVIPSLPPTTTSTPASAPISISPRTGRKRGIDYRCESCNKIYRHPNCLNKHRWEHTRQWRAASKFVLSKHQQVQLLEAATILSYMGSRCSTSLPEDHSEWPSFLSGGSLPKVGVEEMEVEQEEGLGQGRHPHHQRTNSVSSETYPGSSSVPPPLLGPRMHDYSLGKAGGAVTQLGPGLLAISNQQQLPPGPAGAAPPVSGAVVASAPGGSPVMMYRDGSGAYPPAFGYAGGGPYSYGGYAGSYGGYVYPHAGATAASWGGGEDGLSLRSGSGSSRSRGRSRSVEVDDEDEDEGGREMRVVQEEEEDVDVAVASASAAAAVASGTGRKGMMVSPRMSHSRSSSSSGTSGSSSAMSMSGGYQQAFRSVRVGGVKEEERAGRWDGMEMELDMDMD